MTYELLYNSNLIDHFNSHDLAGFYQIDQFAFLKEIENNFGTIKDEWNSINTDKTLYTPWIQKWLLSDPLCWELIILKSRQSHRYDAIQPRRGNQMNVKELAEQAIYRAQNLQEFTVLRDENDMILNGTIRYDLRHKPGTPYRITVPAMTQAEAEVRVDEWIQEMRSAE
jgi:hypothetical protein